MAILVTAAAGVVALILALLALRLVIRPLKAQRETIERIASFLVEHGTQIAYPGFEAGHPLITASVTTEEDWKAQLEAATETARALANDLVARTEAIPCYTLLERAGRVRPMQRIRDAQIALLRLHMNLLHVSVSAGQQNLDTCHDIQQALGVEADQRANL